MAYFASAQPTEKITLPSNKNYWVEIYKNISWGQTKHFIRTDSDGNVDMVAGADGYLAAIIKDWNLDDEAGNKVPVTPEAIDQLEQTDALALLNAAGISKEETENAKKN